MARRTTINDVARRAAVGKVTVSYVLNGRATEVGISSETSERVFAAAKELDYRPSAIARMLVGSKADAIAVVFQHARYFSTSSMFLSEVMRGVCEACTDQNVDLLLHTKSTDDARDEANALSDGRVDGVLMLRDEGDPTLAALIERQFPVVLFFSRSSDPNVPFVDSDNFSGGKLAASHLLSLGHTRLGMVAGSPKSIDSSDRLQGFRSTLEAAGHSLDPAHVVHMPSPGADPEDFLRMIDRPDRPSGLFVWSDDVAFECMRLLHEKGIQIPTDMSLVGFDSTSACLRAVPPLTSVRQPIAEMAASATSILTSIVRGHEVLTRQIVFPPQLDIRGSTSPIFDQR